MLLLSAAGYAQYTFSGTVLTSTGSPVANQTVSIYTDSLHWTVGMSPGFFTSAVTNSAGAYTATLPSSITSGHPILAATQNCSGPYLQNSHTYAGVNITSNFTKCVPPPPPSVNGMITAGSSGAGNAKVYLILKYLDSNMTGLTWKLRALDSGLTNSSGNYSINKPTVPFGDSLLVKAFLLPASSVYANYLPTYYTSSLLWSGATVVNTSGSGSVTVNISLIAGTNPGGPGFIGGDVTAGANKGTAVGDPVAGREIILTDGNNNAVAYTYSDANGKFSFSNVAFGTYKIFGDVMGKTSNPLTFTIGANNPSVNTIRFVDNSSNFNATLYPSSVANASSKLAAITAYPNPMSNTLYINGMEAIGGTKEVRIADITGKVVYQHTFAAHEAGIIEVQPLSNGLYILQVATEEGTATMKITK